MKFTSQRNFKKDLYIACKDFIGSFACWRIFYVIGINDIKKRYARSRIGQLWLTLSLCINIATISVVWSYLFKLPLSEYLPFLAIGTIVWQYISICIIEGASLYITSASYLRELNIPKLTYVNSLIIRNVVVLGHNLLVLIPIYLICSMSVPFAGLLLSIFGFIITSLFLFSIVIFVSLISLRFRDFPNIISSIMQIVFYVTPIIWKTHLMPERFYSYLILNPFAVFLSICRDPLLDVKIPDYYWLAAFIYTIIAWTIAFSFFSKFRTRIVYWL